ncbi:MAG: RNA methyltransferase [Acidobacteriota bacterium]|nr:RNA methyltransferase [Acidobacteriota bacterium]
MTEPEIERLGRHGARVKDLRRRIKHRRGGEVIVEGRRLVDDLVRWRVPISELYLNPEAAAAPESSDLISAAGVVFEVEASVLADLAPTRTSQGLLAVTEEPRWPRWNASTGVALWLDRLQDPGNLGAIVRAAAGLGAAVVMLSPDCTDPFGPGTVRGSAGAVFRIPIERGLTAEKAVGRVREKGGEIWATGAGGRPVVGWDPIRPCLLLLGAEGAGLSPEAGDLADGELTIPLSNEIESLNVAVATGILLQHLRES